MMILTNCEGKVGIEKAKQVLLSNGSSLDAIEQGIRLVEADITVDSVGRGGSPNLLGEMECDAGIMNGVNLLAGSVGALKNYLHAISVARAVMEKLPHVMLVGEGAHRFAQEINAEKVEMLTDEARFKHEKWLKENVATDDKKNWPNVSLAKYAWLSGKDYASGGTVVFLAIDSKGNIGAGTSTSGWARSYPGRLGDSPIIGAGLYADNRYGACACTHNGEMTIRTGAARSVILYIKKGASVKDACYEAMRDLLYLQKGQIGAVVIHAIDKNGDVCVLSSHDLKDKSSYYLWRDEMKEIEHKQAEIINV
jgi:L-asparaginase